MMNRGSADALLVMSRHLEQRITAIWQGCAGVEGGERLLARIGELARTSLLPMMRRQKPAVPQQLEALRHDLDQLWAIWRVACVEADRSGSVSVLVEPGASDQSLTIDITTEASDRWIQVEVSNDFGLQSERWKALRARAKQTLLAQKAIGAQGSPSVAYAFPNGAVADVKAALREMGIEVMDGTIDGR